MKVSFCQESNIRCRRKKILNFIIISIIFFNPFSCSVKNTVLLKLHSGAILIGEWQKNILRGEAFQMEIRPVKADNKKFLTPVKKAMQKYNMLEPGDRIAVGLSGGKDSSTLFYILTLLQKQLPLEFDLVPITLALGFDDMDISPLEKFVNDLGSRLHIKPTQIGRIVFDVRNEKNPCSLCANLRRGALYNTAKSLGCNKAALGHHLDDAIETLLMNLVFSGRLGVFHPKSYLDRRDITVIRPMIFLEEKTIGKIVKSRNIPVIENTCPANKNTKREEMKMLVDRLSRQYPDIRYKFLHAIQSVNPDDFWNKRYF